MRYYSSTKRNTSNSSRPGRQSLKFGCGWYINATNPRLPEGRDPSVIENFVLKLEHTNGCLCGDDLDMNYFLHKSSGQKYPEHVLNQLRTEVKAGR